MKKILIIIVLIIAVVVGVLAWMTRGSEFVFQKKLWSLEQQLSAVLADPKSSPDNLYFELETKYEGELQNEK